MSRPALWVIAAGRKREAKAKKPVRKVSKSMAKKLREYSRLKKEFLMDGDQPRLCAPCVILGCYPVKVATEPHHKRGRGKYLLDVSTWLPTCRRHHDMIHQHPQWAKGYGWILPRV